jgi:DNA-binding NarL/FixJ family response regulator
VDDYELWRTFVASTFQTQPELRIVGEATNGLDAVQIAQQLQPDLILLDIGLPKLNGLQAAPQIRKVSPQSKILFASENRSVDIVKEALGTGAGGYVVKSDAGSDLLPAVNAILAGKRFVSASLSGYDITDLDDPQPDTHRQRDDFETIIPAQHTHHYHEVGFYSDDRHFLEQVTRFIGAALRAGNAAIVVATESHRANLLSELRGYGQEVRAAIAEGRYFSLDAEETLSMFVVNGVIDPARFLELFGDLLITARETTKVELPRVAVFGECVHLLWAQGKTEAAIQMEKLGNKLTQIHDVDILCGYSLGSAEVGMDHNLFQRICAEHSAVYSP